MIYGIDFGHNNPFDTGAVGYKTEDKLNTEVGIFVVKKLKSLGHTVIDCTGRNGKNLIDSLAEKCKIANTNNVDVFVSIHFNAGGGHGTEVFAISSAGKHLAESIVNKIAALGYTNRGVKIGSNLYVLKHTKMPAVLVECAFVDSKEDMDRYDAEAISEAIVKGLNG
ncbi:N-acetylmuramoyl-L-alanine amidase [Clostridium tagluense]|uniref:N-acetylmuramoyl-L-alanine amidase n=1 Tax=Clostridium tagluense TaxID=360422 RepID=UPI001C6E5921|nr:N-acetylmuramoyl-L-alanine amidase [Clostridium tagluense]MBW9159330.1 N-acetylmuramoyl-L-alanine amidase [Clostridium tagluense]WLC68094.1 N-acetylmuramoyl-L-alanine amidase [Clostridium tagluense]